MSRAKKKAAAPTEPTIRVTLAPSIIEVRRLELGTVRRQLAEKAGELAELAGATKRAKAAVVELTARQEQLVAAVADGAEDQPAQLWLPETAPRLPALPDTDRAIAVPVAPPPAALRAPRARPAPRSGERVEIVLRADEQERLAGVKGAADALFWDGDTEIPWVVPFGDDPGDECVSEKLTGDALARARAFLEAHARGWCEQTDAGRIPFKAGLAPPPAPADDEEPEARRG